jgi:hypothetical protein
MYLSSSSKFQDFSAKSPSHTDHALTNFVMFDISGSGLEAIIDKIRVYLRTRAYPELTGQLYNRN